MVTILDELRNWHFFFKIYVYLVLVYPPRLGLKKKKWGFDFFFFSFTQKTKTRSSQKTNDKFFARTGKAIDDVGRERRAENAAGRRDYHALERHHDAVARAREVAVAQMR